MCMLLGCQYQVATKECKSRGFKGVKEFRSVTRIFQSRGSHWVKQRVRARLSCRPPRYVSLEVTTKKSLWREVTGSPFPPSLILHPWILEKAPRQNGKSTQLNKFWVRKVLDDFPFPNDWFWIYFLNTSVRKFCETGWFFTNSPKFCAGNRRAVGQELKFAHASLWSLCWQMLGKSSICTYNYLSFDIYHQAFAGKKGKNERFRMSIMSRKRNNRLITRIKIQDIQRNIEPDHQHLISDLFLYLVTHIFPRFCPSEQFISKTLFGVSRLQPLSSFKWDWARGSSGRMNGHFFAILCYEFFRTDDQR